MTTTNQKPTFEPDLFVRCLWGVFRREASVLESYADRFPIPSVLSIDEVTFGYLACKQFLLLTGDDVVVRKEQWVGARNGLAGKRCDVVLGDATYARHWIEIKVWKPGRDTGFNTKAIWADIDKLRSRVDSGDRQIQTYSTSVKIVVPDDFTRRVLVLRVSDDSLPKTAWTLRREGEVANPSQVLEQSVGSGRIYLVEFLPDQVEEVG